MGGAGGMPDIKLELAAVLASFCPAMIAAAVRLWDSFLRSRHPLPAKRTATSKAAMPGRATDQRGKRRPVLERDRTGAFRTGALKEIEGCFPAVGKGKGLIRVMRSAQLWGAAADHAGSCPGQIR